MRLLRVMIFFPSVTPLFGAAEIFPWATLYTITKRKLSLPSVKYLLILLLLIISSLFSLFHYSFINSLEVFRSLIAYLNPILIFLTLLKISNEEVNKISKLVKHLFIFLLILGLLQYFNLLNLFGLGPILKFFVPRSEGHSVGLGRGVTLLSSEPGRAGPELLFIYLIFRLIWVRKAIHAFFFDVFLLAYQIFIIKSGIGLFFCIIFIFTTYRIWALFFICTLAFILYHFEFENRSLSVALNILNSTSLPQIIQFLLNESGFRFASVYGAYHEGIHSFLGHGVGGWKYSSFDAMVNAGINPFDYQYFNERKDELNSFAVRPYSFLANISLDTGIVGVFFLIDAFKKIILTISSKSKEHLSITVLFIFSILFVGSVGNPIPWIALALAYRYRVDLSILSRKG